MRKFRFSEIVNDSVGITEYSLFNVDLSVWINSLNIWNDLMKNYMHFFLKG